MPPAGVMVIEPLVALQVDGLTVVILIDKLEFSQLTNPGSSLLVQRSNNENEINNMKK
jgi:hypothetical protein